MGPTKQSFSQEQLAYNVLYRRTLKTQYSVYTDARDLFTNDFVRGTVEACTRVSVAGIILVAWGMYVYYSSVWPWIRPWVYRDVDYVPLPTYLMIVLAPILPLILLTLDIIRNYMRFDVPVRDNEATNGIPTQMFELDTPKETLAERGYRVRSTPFPWTPR